MTQKTYLLEKLDCAHCASLIETSVGRLNGVENASLNFMNKRLKIELADSLNDSQQQRITISIRNLVTALEPEVVVVEETAAIPTLENKQAAKAAAQARVKTEAKEFRCQVWRLAASALLYAGAIAYRHFYTNEAIIFAFFFIALLVAGGNVIFRAIRNIFNGKIFDENFLMSLATIGAFAIGDYSEGVAVMIFYQVGELFQNYAVGKSRRSIASLMDIRPDYANLKQADGSFAKVSPEEVAVGSQILVKAGERVPLDGKVLEGASSLDTSALTGESLPREVAPGDQVLSGCINKNGLLTIEVTKTFGDSTISKILDMVENASSKKSHSENFISKFARYYTPAVVIVAVLLALLPPLLLAGEAFSTWVYRALVFLVISCPCALVISVPLGFFGGIGGASKLGILVKGSNYLEALAQTEIAVFDKTGTLTKGVFQVTAIVPTENFNKNQLLTAAAYAESYSNHPIALSLRQAYEQSGQKLDAAKAEQISQSGSLEEIAGHGVKALVNGETVLAGNAKLMQKFNIAYPSPRATGTIVHVAINNSYAGYLVINDEPKADAAQAIAGLKAANVKQTVMLTGDAKQPGEAVAKALGIDQAYTQLLPGDKVEKVEELLAQTSAKGKLAFVGDGINDAPVLARADIGIAMGGLGSDAAIEAADVVIMTDEPSKVATAMKISKHTLRIVKQNIIFALGVKALVLVLGAMGWASMWAAVFADVGVAFLAILNAARALRVEKYR